MFPQPVGFHIVTQAFTGTQTWMLIDLKASRCSLGSCNIHVLSGKEDSRCSNRSCLVFLSDISEVSDA